MSEGHYCVIHKVPFFKKGKMRNYAHPIEGTDPVEWCNEEEKTEEKVTETPTEKPAHIPTKPFQRGSPEERSSIESQVAFKGIVELLVGKVIDLKHPLTQTVINYASSKLSNWSSMGPVEEAETIEGLIVTKEQLKKIANLAKDKGYTPDLAVSVMIRKFNIANSKQLTEKQADEFIKLLEAGYGLKEVEPRDIPF